MQSANASGLKTPNHDIEIVSVVTGYEEGIKESSKNSLSKSLEIARFNPENKSSKKLRGSKLNGLPETMRKYKNDNTIVSISYAPNEDEWGKIVTATLSGYVEIDSSLIVDEKIKLTGNALFLVALDNKIENREKFIKYFKEAQKNIWLVSTSGENKADYRKDIGVDFFTILSNYSYPVKVKINENGEIINYSHTFFKNPQTSYATPLLALIIKNIRTLSPSLSFDDIKSILKITAHNADGDVKNEGYIVNPKIAYEYTIGSLLANAQKKYYKNCNQGHVFGKIKEKRISWKIICKNNDNIEDEWKPFDYVENSLKDFFNGSHVITEQNKKLVVNKNYNNTAHPNNITLENIDINFDGNMVRVEFIKKYKADKKPLNKTKKISFIDYKEGSPKLKTESVILN